MAAKNRIVEVTKVEEMPGKRVSVALFISDPWASELANWAEQAGKPLGIYLEEQFEALCYQGAIPAV